MEGGGGATPAVVAEKRQKSLPVEIAIATANNGLLGAALGALYSRIPPKLVVSLFLVVSMCAMREITGKDDTKNTMVSGFTSGFMFHLVGRMPSRPRVPAAVGTGLFFAVSFGLIHEVDGLFRGTALEDTHVFGARKG